MDPIVNKDQETPGNREESTDTPTVNDTPDAEHVGEIVNAAEELGENVNDTPDAVDLGENNDASKSAKVISNDSWNLLKLYPRLTRKIDGPVAPICNVCKLLVPWALKILTPWEGTRIRMTPVFEVHTKCCKHWREAQVRRLRDELAIAIMNHRCDDAELNAIAKDIDLNGDLYGKFRVDNGVITMIPQVVVTGDGGASGASVNIANNNGSSDAGFHIIDNLSDHQSSGDAGDNASDVRGGGDQASN